MKRAILNFAALAVAVAAALFCATCNGKGTAVGDDRWEGDVDRLMEMFNEKHGFPPKDTTPTVVTPPITPPDTVPPVTPPDSGVSYDYVELGGLKWMNKNLNVETADSWCYDDSKANCDKYGRLYTWSAAKTACQSIGWRLPTNADWEALVGYADDYEEDYYTAGKNLKSKTGWYDNSGTDKYGFSALPGGLRDDGGGFDNAVFSGYWWTATGIGSGYAYYRSMYYEEGGVNENGNDVGFGFSVRCVKD